MMLAQTGQQAVNGRSMPQKPPGITQCSLVPAKIHELPFWYERFLTHMYCVKYTAVHKGGITKSFQVAGVSVGNHRDGNALTSFLFSFV